MKEGLYRFKDDYMWQPSLPKRANGMVNFFNLRNFDVASYHGLFQVTFGVARVAFGKEYGLYSAFIKICP